MRRAFAVVAGILFVVVSAAAVFLGPARYVPRAMAPAIVGAVHLDSGATVAALTAIEELRIDGNTEEFADFSGYIRVAPNGNIVVPQGQDYQYRFYSPEGRRLATFGGRGSGPGEFRTFETRLGWTGDTLWIWDKSLDRVTYVSSDGTYLGSESFRMVFAAPRDWGRFPMAMTVAAVEGIRDGEFVVSGQEWELFLPGTWLAMRRPLVAVGPMQVIRRVVGNFPLLGDGDFVPSRVGGGRPYEIALPLRALPRYDIAPDASRLGYLTTHVDDESGGHLALTILSTSGDTLVSRRYAFTGEPIPERVRDSVLAEHEARASRAGRGMPVADPAAHATARAEAPKRALPVYAPVASLVLGRDSTTWIGFRSTAPLRTWLVLDAAGEPIGSLSLPSNLNVSEAQRDAVWATQPDTNDVRAVIRYRVSGW